MNISCSAEPCPIILDGTCVFYTGANLIYTGIVTNDSLSAALYKIDQKFKDAAVGYVFQNGLIQAVPGGPVKLGGTLNQNTVITSAGHTLALTGTIESSAFITTGGTSSQFVKGDGSLDSTAYQPTGNYITALTGDGTATGPGSVPFTLSTTGVIANTYGSATKIPIITVDDKGRITWATSTTFTVPPALLIFSGDVTGVGYTNTTIPLTLNTVLSTPGTFGSTTNIPVVTVNDKGLVTGISQVPFSSGSGTVTSVGVSAGTGISASVANPTTTPVITITNTAPDQIVALSAGTGISVTGTYPNFTITATGGTVPTLQQVTVAGSDTTFSITSFSTSGFQVKTPVNQVLATLQSNVGQTEGQVFIADVLGSPSTTYKRTGILAGTNTLTFPNATATLAVSVNNTFADANGNITISTGGITSVTATTPLASSGGTTPNITIQQASGSQAGYLSSTDWTTFNSKQDPISLTTTGTSGAATFIANTLNIPQYQAAGTYVTSVGATGPITSSGGTTPTISTSMATNKLIGRSSAGVGVMEEITVGSGLTLSGGTLTNTATPTPLGYYGAWQDMLTQTAAVSNVGYPFIFRTIDLENQVRVVTNGTDLTRITFDNTGIYNLQFSAQIQNTDNAQHDVTIWLRKNGTDVTGSAGFISVPARKSAGAGNEGHGVYGWNYLLSVVAGEYYEIVWSTSDATHITIQYYAAGSPPPSTASVLATVTQQSGIMAGTGITAINSLTGSVQTLATGTTGTDFAVSSSGTTHTLNLPDASATNRGALTSANWTTFNNKQDDSAWVNASSQAVSGYTGTPTKNIQYKLLGNKTAILQWEITGTGSGGGASMTLPFTSSAFGTQYAMYQANQATTAIGICQVTASSTTLTFYPNATIGSAFSAGQTRNLRGQMIINIV